MKSKLTATIAIAMVAMMMFSAVGMVTYSWFADEESVEVDISSGKVDVSIDVNDFKMYSYGIDDPLDKFTNGGTANVVESDGKVSISSNGMSAGDYVTFKISYINNSTIDIVWRAMLNLSGDLANIVEIKDISDSGSIIYPMYQKWTFANFIAEGTVLSERMVSVGIPMGVDLSTIGDCTVEFIVDAAQGNAPVVDYELSDASQFDNAIANGGVITTNGNELILGGSYDLGDDVVFNDAKLNMNVSEPTADSYGFYVGGNNSIELVDTEVTTNVGNAIVALYCNDSKISLRDGAKLSASDENIAILVQGGELEIYIDSSSELTGNIVVGASAKVNIYVESIEQYKKYSSVVEDDGTDVSISLEVMLAEDATYGSKLSGDVSINLNDNALNPISTMEVNSFSDFSVSNGVISADKSYGHFDIRPGTGKEAKVVFENITYTNNYKSPTYGPSTNRTNSFVEYCATNEADYVVFEFKDCTFNNGYALFEGLSGKCSKFKATFDNCTFNNLSSSAAIEVANYVEGELIVKDCTFNLEVTSSTASAISVSPSTSTQVNISLEGNNMVNWSVAEPYTFDPSKGETSVDNVKVNGTITSINALSVGVNTTVTGSENIEVVKVA